MNHYAHTLEGRPSSEWQRLETHLSGVAELAAERAEWVGAPQAAELLGLWHDLGKYSQAFQEYLHASGSRGGHEAETSGRIDHSTAGAQRVVREFGILGQLLAYPIAGHHAGLADPIGGRSSLRSRLDKSVEPIDPPEEILDVSAPDLPEFVRRAMHPNSESPLTISLFVRLLFSCLVDADFLDTERFMSPERAAGRADWPADVLESLQSSLDAHLEQLADDSTKVNRIRGRVLGDAIDAAESDSGLFTFTVPTGGGKTLSSMAFALRHARRHRLRRVVYVCPYTSIIEQTADVFREVFGRVGRGRLDPVVEHHSNLDPVEESWASRLATENWDAPIVVTTAVQFYESLFACRSSRCRKLHNLVGSVIILDEAQALPVDYLEPCLAVLRELTDHYGSTVVLCTATQPAVTRSEEFPIGLAIDSTREIVSDPDGLYSDLDRVSVRVRDDPVPDRTVAEQLLEQRQVLCVVNTRHHARELFLAMGGAEAGFHLSAAMCPEHRSAQLARIRARIEADEPCRVVATRLIEAGVDIDFPVVWRSLAGIDSIAQAAGRCNRNGKLERGQVVVFRSEHGRREVFIRDTQSAASQVLELHSDDPLGRSAVERYFRLYYWHQRDRWDRHAILDHFQLDRGNKSLAFLFRFRSADRAFRLIEETGRSVIVPWGERGAGLVERLRRSWPGPDVTLLRQLQRYTVQVSDREWASLMRLGLELVHDEFGVLTFMTGTYDSNLGVTAGDGSPQLLNA